ncbi:MAG: ROK family protein [Limnochordaceae bacterium]|nr:ROK family protein [Limnochordaceae bacterium]
MRVIGQPPLLRKINQRAVLELLRKQGPMSRAELTRALRLSKSTVSQVVMSLLERGLVREEGRHPASPGAGGPRRRSVRLEVVPEAGFVVGIDLGGTLLRAAVADLGGEIRARHTEPTEHRGLPELLAQLEGAVRQVMSAAHVPADRLLSVAVGVPGAVSAVNRCVQLCPNLPALQDVEPGPPAGRPPPGRCARRERRKPRSCGREVERMCTGRRQLCLSGDRNRPRHGHRPGKPPLSRHPRDRW